MIRGFDCDCDCDGLAIPGKGWDGVPLHRMVELCNTSSRRGNDPGKARHFERGAVTYFVGD
jgi:hypothetical protein